MYQRRLYFIVVGLILSCGISVWAQEPTIPNVEGPTRGQRTFAQIPSFADTDRNKDGKISRDEFPGPPPFFERIDENKDGTISEEEWGNIRRRMEGAARRFTEQLAIFLDANSDSAISREEFSRLNLLFDNLDKDKDGQVSTTELSQFTQSIEELQRQSTGGVEVANLFEKFDKNKDGKITAEEMNNERVFKPLDLDKDGALSREEASRALKQLAERSRQR
jgi:Ca2+-binding EF-hand superfamily protein